MTCLPVEFVERQTKARMRSEQLWRDLRAKNDWAGFLPALEGVVAMVREEAALRAARLGLDPYDALMEQYDPGNRAADIAPVFAELKSFLGTSSRSARRQEERLARTPSKPLPALSHRQAARARPRHDGGGGLRPHPWQPVGLASSLLRRRADRRTHHHALQTSDFLSALMGVLHETGHALYEQDLPEAGLTGRSARRAAWRSTRARACSWKSRSAATRPSGQWALPVVEKYLGEDGRLDDILPHVHDVEAG